MWYHNMTIFIRHYIIFKFAKYDICLKYFAVPWIPNRWHHMICPVSTLSIKHSDIKLLHLHPMKSDNNIDHLEQAGVCEKVTSDSGGFYWVLQFPPPLTNGYSHNLTTIWQKMWWKIKIPDWSTWYPVSLVRIHAVESIHVFIKPRF